MPCDVEEEAEFEGVEAGLQGWSSVRNLTAIHGWERGKVTWSKEKSGNGVWEND